VHQESREPRGPGDPCPTNDRRPAAAALRPVREGGAARLESRIGAPSYGEGRSVLVSPRRNRTAGTSGARCHVRARSCLVHRRDSFRAHAHSVKLLRDSTVSLCIPAQVVGISGSDRVEAVSVRNTETKQVTELPAQEVVAALGFTADITPLEAWGLNVEERHIVVDTTMATNLRASSLPATSRSNAGKVRLISVGFGEVATAVCNAATVIDPEATVFPGHSTGAQGEGRRHDVRDHEHLPRPQGHVLRRGVPGRLHLRGGRSFTSSPRNASTAAPASRSARSTRSTPIGSSRPRTPRTRRTTRRSSRSSCRVVRHRSALPAARCASATPRPTPRGSPRCRPTRRRLMTRSRRSAPSWPPPSARLRRAMDLLADDIEYQNMPLPPVHGKAAVRETSRRCSPCAPARSGSCTGSWPRDRSS